MRVLAGRLLSLVLALSIGAGLWAPAAGPGRPFPAATAPLPHGGQAAPAQALESTPPEEPPLEDTLPESCLLPVANIAQRPQLPNGCEGTSLTILLNYLGYPAEKQDIAYNYLPRQPFEYTDGVYYGGNPEYTYVGNPGGNGYYCYARPVVMAANQYFYNQASAHRALDCTGLSEEDIVALVAAGHPLIVWKTIDHTAPRRREHLAWTLHASGEAYAPLVNLHVVVLCGYDAETFYFCDPLNLAPTMERAAFMDLFTQMGSRAVAIF